MPPYRMPEESDAEYYERYAELARIFLERRHKARRIQFCILIVSLAVVIGTFVATFP